MLNPSPDIGIDSIFNLNTESTSLVDVPVTTIAETPLSSTTTLPPPPIPLIRHLQQTPVPTPATVPSSSLQDLPNFGSLFEFDHKLKTLENNFLEFKQTNQFVTAISSIPGIVDTYLANKMNEAVKITSHAVAANLSEMELKNILIYKIERNKLIHRSDEQKNLYKALDDAYKSDKLILDTYGDTVMMKRRQDDHDEDEEPSDGSNRGSKRRRAGKEPESTIAPKEKTSNNLARKEDTRDSFNELLDTPLYFSAFMMNRLKVDNLTPKLLVGPTFELKKGSCKSLVELEYFLEEVYKATTDQLDWNNPKGQQYPHDLRKPLPLIPNSQGRRVIPFDHFINNDLAYLRGGTSIRTYATSVTKTKAADYGHVKWIEDLVPNTMWSPVLHKIIAVTKLPIFEWHNYKHLDWITILRNDQAVYIQRRVNSFTMKMEILLEPTSNKLMVEHAEFDESDTHVLERFDTLVGNPVKEILPKLNLPDHSRIPYGFKGILKDGGEGT
ncbi:hypothetical protein Tco_0995100 [Tanacetum coccineum]